MWHGGSPDCCPAGGGAVKRKGDDDPRNKGEKIKKDAFKERARKKKKKGGSAAVGERGGKRNVARKKTSCVSRRLPALGHSGFSSSVRPSEMRGKRLGPTNKNLGEEGRNDPAACPSRKKKKTDRKKLIIFLKLTAPPAS